MKSMKDIQISIKRIAGRKGEYVAYYRSEFLDATFSVCFKDNILGAVALQSFSEMIKLKYEGDRVDFELTGERVGPQKGGLVALYQQTALSLVF